MLVIKTLAKIEDYFVKHGIATARTDAELLLSSVIGCRRLDIFLDYDKEISEAQLDLLRTLSIRRVKREPLQYIIGNVFFYGQKLYVDKNVLIPRNETEELVDNLRNMFIKNPPKKILDLGTGSGAIAIALASVFKDAEVTAVDNSNAALDVAIKNANYNNQSRIKFINSGWFSKINDKYDLIVSNPPYLTQTEFEEAMPEIKFEPINALVAKDNGLKCIKTIIANAYKFLTKFGTLAIETGINQHEILQDFAKNFQYTSTTTVYDLHKRERFLYLSMA